MAQRRNKDWRVVRNRRVIIYTFLMILALFYVSAHRQLEKERALAGMEQSGGGGDTAAELGQAENAVENVAGNAAGRNRNAGVGDAAAGMDRRAVVGDADAGQAEGQELTMDGQDADAAGREPEAGNAGYAGDAQEQNPADELSITQDDMWCLILTNAEYPVPEDYMVNLKAVPGTEQTVDERIYEPLMEMLDAMKAQGLSPEVCSGYRTLDKQEKLFNRKVQSYVRSGHSKEESYTLARQTISIPGSGEHCLGLAVDFYAERYHRLERGFENTPEGQWLMEHAQDYGFIMRYGEDKVDITGIEYEPWHYRYVGVKAAKYMKEHNLSLEEFYIEQSLYG